MIGQIGTVDMSSQCEQGPIKVKAGLAPFDQELDSVRALLTQCADVPIRIDANGAWNYEQTQVMCALLETHPHTILEQPMPADAFSELDKIQANTNTIIALDESTILDPETALDTQCKELVIKPMCVGGFSAGRRLVQRSQDASKQVSITHVLEGRVGRAGTAHFAAGVKGAAIHGVRFDDHRGSVDISSDIGHGVVL